MPGPLSLIRPFNCLMAFFSVIVGAVAEVGLDVTEKAILVPVMLAAIVATVVTAAGNAINDYYDRKVDKVAHPERPIPSGQVRPATAYWAAAALFLLGVALAILVNPVCFAIAAFNSFLLISYELRLKDAGLPGNAIISWLTASLFLFGGAAVVGMGMRMTLFLAFMAFFATLGREVIKDVQDMEGDQGTRVTLPMSMGQNPATGVAAVFISIAVVAAICVYYPLGVITHYAYLVLVIVASLGFGLTIFESFTDPARAQSIAKASMFIGLLAFTVAGLVI